MIRFLKKGIILGLGILLGVSFAILTNLDYPFAHEGTHKSECCSEPCPCEP